MLHSRLMCLRHLVFILLTAVAGNVLRADTLPPINYTLRFPEALHHYVEVEADLPTAGRDQIELFMPTWTPGSYLLREYARNLDRIAATAPDGSMLELTKTTKNRWTVATAGHNRVRVTYRLYGWEPSVRTNFIEGDFAMLNGAPTYLTLVEHYQRPYTVRVELPSSWKGSYTPLPAGAEPNTYTAPDFDTLVDSPLLAGSPQVDSFTLNGNTHYLVTIGGAGVWDNAKAARHFEQVAKTQNSFWGQFPTNQPYYVFNLLIGGRGGLEHKQAFVVTTDRWLSATNDGLRDWLSLVSHEYFHLWNGKRLRPVELGPFPYEHEAYTKTLWVVEGITSYYQHLMLRRAAYYSQTDYLNVVSSSIAGVERTPGRLVQSLADSSFDAWIKGYRPDENSANSRVSYYSAGAIAALLLDTEIRRLSNGAKSLDDVMRAAFSRYSGEQGYTEAQFTALASEVAGADLTPWFARLINTPGQFDYQPMLDWFGLNFQKPKEPNDSTLPNGLEPPDAPIGWLGADLRGNVITTVRANTPAYMAGLYAGDEIIAVDGFRTADSPDDVLRYRHPNDSVELLVARRGQVLSIRAVLGTTPRAAWRLVAKPDATPEQKAHLAAWIGPADPEAEPAPLAPLPELIPESLSH